MKKLSFLTTVFLISTSLFAQSISTNNISTSTKNADTSNSNTTFETLPYQLQLAISNPNYMVTPGDIYSLTYAAGTTGISYKIIVDSSYKIRVSNLAVLDANGKTYVQLKKQVEDIVSKNYPLSGVQFLLASPATFKVIVNGAVTRTTEQDAWALTRLSEVIASAPLNQYSSGRFVKITKSNGTTENYDLFKKIRYSDYSQDPYIRPGDVITIQKTEKKVQLTGAIVFPGTYELSKNENLQELINNLGGGLSPTADTSRIELTRQISKKNKTGEKFYLSQNDLDKNYELINLDSIFIETFENLKPRFKIEGAIKTSQQTANLEASNQISVKFEDGAVYDFIIRKNESWFSSISDIENAYIIRGEEIIPINIQKILEDSEYYSNITIVQNDVLRIPFKQFFVSVAGSVMYPGRYPYIPDRTYEYYIGLAGGFNKIQNSMKSVKIVDMEGKKLSKKDIITPETTITAKSNSFLFYFNQVAPVVTTTLSIVTASLSVYAALNK